MNKALMMAAALLTLATTAGPSIAAQQYISIATGAVTGVYYPTGGAICRLVNKGRKPDGIRCFAEPTGGSVFNIDAVRSGEMQFGVAQSDSQHHAYNGTAQFAKQGKFDKLRSVFSVHPEPFTLLVRKDASVSSFQDLKGKKVNIGNPGSGQRATMEVVMDAFGMNAKDFALAAELKGSETAQAVCEGKIDAMIYTIGHPAPAVTEAATSCDVELVDVSGEPIDKLIADNPYYRAATIPAGLYKGTERAVNTFGVGATVITSADVSSQVVYKVVQSVFDNFDEFRKLHPAFSNLTESEMIADGLSAPIHDGAARYYKERGWLK